MDASRLKTYLVDGIRVDEAPTTSDISFSNVVAGVAAAGFRRSATIAGATVCGRVRSVRCRKRQRIEKVTNNLDLFEKQCVLIHHAVLFLHGRQPLARNPNGCPRV